MDENTPLSKFYADIRNDPSILDTIETKVNTFEISLKDDIKALDQFYETIIDGYYLIRRSSECFKFTIL